MKRLTEYSQTYVLEHKATGITGVGASYDEAIDSLIDGLYEYMEGSSGVAMKFAERHDCG